MKLQTIVLSFMFVGTWLSSDRVHAGELEAEFATQLATATTESRTPLALQAVMALQRLAPYSDFETFRSAVTKAAKDARNPLARFQLSQLATQAAMDAQDESFGPRAQSLLQDQACLTTWSIVGPFSNENMEAFKAPLGPEVGDPGPFAGKTVDVAWRALPTFDRQCEYWLSQVVEPDSAAVVYLASTIHVSKAQKATLLLGTHGAYRVWVNGTLVGENPEDYGMAPDADGWKVSLDKGSNTILLKLASTGSGTLGAIARLVDTHLRPIPFTAVDGQMTVPAAVKDGGKATADPRAVRASAIAMAHKGAPNEAIYAAWLWEQVSGRDVSTPWRNVASRLLSDPSKLTPRQHALVAEMFEEESKQLAIVEAASKRAPDDPFITTRLAALYERGITETRKFEARKLLEDVLKADATFLPARLQLFSWFRARGFGAMAYKLVLDAGEPTQPSLMSRALTSSDELGTREEHRALLDKALHMAFFTGSWVWERVRDLSALGEHEEALQWVQKWRILAPVSSSGARYEAQQLRALGRLQEAADVWSSMIEINPGDADLLRQRAEVFVALGQTDRAREDIEAALLRRPQDQFLRDYAAFLKPQETRFWDDWIIEDVAAFASSVPPTPFNYDTLIDQSITYVAPNGLSQSVHQSVERVLTADGIDDAKFQRIAYQGGDERVDVLRVRVYKADGTISEDFDQWETGGARKASTTYNDTGFVNIRANNVSVGDVVEVQWRLAQVANANFRGDYFGDITYVQGNRPIAMLRYAVLYPRSWELFFRVPSLKYTRTDDVVPGGAKLPTGFRSTSFELRDVPYVQTDPDQPGHTDVYDYLLVSNKKTWGEIGVWWWNLIKEQLIVDDEMRAEVKRLTDGKKTVDEKVRAIHNYVVRNTRYLHVGLGIHGWKPYRTTTAFRNRYGDCKDKAALMKVLLETAGVEAQMVLVRTRGLGSVDEFPASMHVFNHAITYVPELDLFLDGTAEFNGTRELTPMDQGAQALVIADGGHAKFIKLPVDKPTQNVMRIDLDVDLTREVPRATGSVDATGVNAVYFRSILEDQERRDEEFEKFLGQTYPGARLVKATYSPLPALEQNVKINFTFESPQLRRSDGSRDFLLPTGTTKDLVGTYAKQAKRSQDLDIRVPFTSESVLNYRIPKNENFKKVPADVNLTSRFGALNISYRVKGDTIEAAVIYRLDVQRVAVEDYGEFRKFVAEMNDALNETITLGGQP